MQSPIPILVVVLLWLTACPFCTAAADGDATHAGLHVGIFPRRPAADTTRMFQPLVDRLAERLGVPVILHTPADYLSFWQGIEQNRFDVVHYNQYHYVRAHRDFGHRIIARNEEHGRGDIRATIVERADGPYRSLSELRGRKILFGGGRSAMVSYILAADLLHDAGLHDGDYIAQFAQNPPKAVVAMYYGQADAAAAGDAVLSAPVVTTRIGTDNLRTLAVSEPIPQLPWAVSRRMRKARRDDVAAVLLGLNADASGATVLRSMRLSGLREARDADYDGVRRIVERVLGEHY